MANPISDPDLLAQLNAPSAPTATPVTDPELLKQLEGPMSWSDVPGEAAKNFIPSLGGVLHDIAQPVIHPIDTATSLKNLGLGVLQKTGLVSGEDSVKYADAVGEYFGNRYGSVEGFKQALAKDPAGVIADASALLTGGETALARAPGLVGKTAEVAGKVGRAIDPLNVITKPVAGAIKLADVPLGLTTGASAAPIAAARAAGREGGAASEAFTSQMRGKAPIDEIVSDARGAVDQMRQDAQAAYARDMAATKANPTQLKFTDIDKAINRMDDIVHFQGRARPELRGVRDELLGVINEWKSLDPAKFHTPAGFDELKKNIYDVVEKIPYEQRTQRKIAGDIFGAVKDTIVKQDPTYAKTMANYEAASNQLREVERSLTGRSNTPIDAALRKLTSVMRNNVNTNFGKRAALVQTLQDAGAPQLTNKIAGASLNSWEPRGLARVIGGGGVMGAIGTALMTGNPLPLAAIPASLAIGSPRAVGEGSHALGVAQRYLNSARPLAELSGRTIGQIPRVTIDTTNFGR